MLTRKRTLVAGAVACAALAIPSVASAEDFCVGGPASCSGTPVAAGGLKAALTAAESNGTDDRFFLAPGTFTADAFSHKSSERVQIVGAGAGNTIVRSTSAGNAFTLGGNAASTIADLTLHPAADAEVGLMLSDGASLSRGRVQVDDDGFGVATVGRGTVTDSSITAPKGVGIVAAGSEMTVRRSTLRALFGAVVAKGNLAMGDTLIDLRGENFGLGVRAVGGSGLGGGTPTADLERLTIVGANPNGTDIGGVLAQADGAGNGATLSLRDSVISGVGVPVARLAANGATANVGTDRSSYADNVSPNFDTGPGRIVVQDRLTASPGFVGNGDFHLAADSPLIDAGTPGALPAGATDRDGKPRASDGDGDCRHVSDIGAFEYQGTRVRAVATAAAATVGAGHSVGFSAHGSCVPGPEAPSVRWSFDDGATAEGETVTHAFATPGRHTATVTVADGHGRAAQATAAVEVTASAAAEPTPVGPRIARLRVTPTRVQIGSPLPKLVRTAIKRPLATILFQLSKRATVTLRFAKVGRNGTARTLKTKVMIKARKGRNRIRFAARLTRTVALAPGNYQLAAVATDPAGAHSKRARTRFTAIKATRR